MKYTMELKDLIMKNGNFPMCTVVLKDENGKEEITGYVTPFRGYRFQVSGTEEGIGDNGSSPVLFMESYCGNNEQCDRELLRGQLALCLMKHKKYFRCFAGKRKHCLKNDDTYELPDLNPLVYYGMDEDKIPVVEKFLDVCVKWVATIRR